MNKNLILVVDDDPVQHAVLKKYLELSDYRTCHAHDGQQALDLLRKQTPAAIVLDIQMPLLDGFDVLDRLQQNPAWSAIPVLVVSSLQRNHLKVKALELGAEDFVEKPFSSAELLARIKRAIGRGRRLHARDHVTSGQLSDLSVIDLVQTLALGRKTALIQLGDIDADLYVEQGCVAGARMWRFVGGTAYPRILLCARGAFAVDFAAARPDFAGDSVEVTQLLMNLSTQLDEVERVLSAFDKGARFALAPDLDEIAAPLAALKSRGPLPIRDLVSALAGDLVEDARLVVAAIKGGDLRPVEEEPLRSARPKGQEDKT